MWKRYTLDMGLCDTASPCFAETGLKNCVIAVFLDRQRELPGGPGKATDAALRACRVTQA